MFDRVTWGDLMWGSREPHTSREVLQHMGRPGAWCGSSASSGPLNAKKPQCNRWNRLTFRGFLEAAISQLKFIDSIATIFAVNHHRERRDLYLQMSDNKERGNSDESLGAQRLQRCKLGSWQTREADRPTPNVCSSDTRG